MSQNQSTSQSIKETKRDVFLNEVNANVITSQNKFLELFTSFSKSEKTLYLVDTGSDICLIKKQYLKGDTICYPVNKLRLHGITTEVLYTLGSCKTKIKISDSLFIDQEFHIVPDEFPLIAHGILGYDFLSSHKCSLNFSESILEFCEFRIKLPLCTHFYDTEIPPRAEKTILLLTDCDRDDDYFCQSKEIVKGVFVSNAIVKSVEKYAAVSVINTNDKSISLKNHVLSVNSVSDYDIHELNNWQNVINNRIAEIESQIDLQDLNSEEESSILTICREYNDVFYVEGDALTTTTATSHSIPTIEDTYPVNVRPYRLPEISKEVISTEVSKMLDNNIIRPSTSPWNSPLLVVPKKSTNNEKKFRVVVDYRRLNNVTIGSVFPLPNICEILEQLGKASYFSTLDLANGYHQIPIDEKDRAKTAFSTSEGHFEFNCMPFGLKGAPSTFQRMMNNILAGVNGIKCFVYLDDIVIYGYDLKDHNSKLIEVIELLRQFNLKLQPKKCFFLRKEILYLGHIISTDGIKVDKSKIDAVCSYPIPQNQKQVKSFLGLASYYRKFIKNFSLIAQPLTDRLRKNNKSFSWDCHCSDSFEKLKHALTNAPVLQYPNFKNTFIVTVDASDYAIGAVLSQKFIVDTDEADLPIAYASRVLNPAERHYATVKKECLAIIFGVRRFRPYIYGRKFLIVTDHRPLIWLKEISKPESILTRWRLELEEYEYEIKHKSGLRNSNADALSRILPPQSIVNVNIVTRAKFQKDIQDPLYFKDPDLDRITHSSGNDSTQSFSATDNYIQNPISNSEAQLVTSPSTKIDTGSECESELSSALLNHTSSNRNLSSDAIDNIVNNDLKNLESDDLKENNVPNRNSDIIELTSDNDIDKVLHEFHYTPLGAHQGIMRTYKRIKSFYFFPKMLERIRKFIKRCEACQKNKAGFQNKLPMTITTTSKKPFEKIFMDIVGPIIPSLLNNRYILTIQDDLTKFSLAIALPNQETNTIARAFVENFVCNYGTPDIILTDQGSNFVSELMKRVCKILKIDKIQTSAYHPQSNGALERSHRTLAEYLRNFTNGDTSEWDMWLPYAMFSYNSTPHTSTNYMPFELLFGYKPNIPTSLQTNKEVMYNFDDYVNELKHRLQASYTVAKKNILKQKEKSKNLYDRNSNEVSFNVGELVLLKKESRSKLDSIWSGPHEIIEILSPTNSKILVKQQLSNNKIKTIQKVIHNNRLKLFNN